MSQVPSQVRLPAYSGPLAGLLGSALTTWIGTTDPRRVARRFLVSGAALLLAAQALMVVVSVERVDPDRSLLGSDVAGQLFSLQRVGAVFLGLVPLVLGAAVVQLGERDIAIVGSGAIAVGFWAWVFGSSLIVVAYTLNGGPGGGRSSMVDLFLGGVAFAVVGLGAVAVSVVVSVVAQRRRSVVDESPDLVDAAVWTAFSGSATLLIAFGALAGLTVLVAVDHVYGRAVFGGNVGVLDAIGWVLSQPVTLLSALVTLGSLHAAVLDGIADRLMGLTRLGTALMSLSVLAASGLVTGALRDAHAPDDLALFFLMHVLVVFGVLAVIVSAAFQVSRDRLRHAPGQLVMAFTGALLVFGGAAGNAVQHVGVAGLGTGAASTWTTHEEAVFAAVAGGTVLLVLAGLLRTRCCAGRQNVPNRAMGMVTALVALGTLLAVVSLSIAGFNGQPALTAGGYDYGGSPEFLNALATAGVVLVVAGLMAGIQLAVREPMAAAAPSTAPASRPVSSTPVALTVATASAAIVAAFGAMLAVWVTARHDAPAPWVPKAVKIPEIPANVMLVGAALAVVLAHLTVYAARRRARDLMIVSTGLLLLVGAAQLNAQSFVFGQMKMAARAGAYQSLYFSIVGAFTALLVAALLYSLVVGVRAWVAPRSTVDLTIGLTITWWMVGAVYSVIWFAIYVTK